MALLVKEVRQTDLENICKRYAEPIGENEETKCDRAERMVRQAIEGSAVFDADKLSQIRIFAQGSYANGTNIPQDSDVDVAVVYDGTYFYDYGLAPHLGATRVNIPAAYTFDKYRADVIRALASSFGQELQIGKKSLKMPGNSGRISADAVPSFQFRRYIPDGRWLQGTRFISSDGKLITNWPETQKYQNTEKNKATGFRYKKVVRILKSLRPHISDNGYPTVGKTPSFLVEALTYNAPNDDFQNPSLLEDCKTVLQSLFFMLHDAQAVPLMKEPSQMKDLFSSEQAWSLQDAQFFVLCAGKELGLWQ
jgi:predicted nucleotidyltransferase